MNRPDDFHVISTPELKQAAEGCVLTSLALSTDCRFPPIVRAA